MKILKKSIILQCAIFIVIVVGMICWICYKLFYSPVSKNDFLRYRYEYKYITDKVLKYEIGGCWSIDKSVSCQDVIIDSMIDEKLQNLNVASMFRIGKSVMYIKKGNYNQLYGKGYMFSPNFIGDNVGGIFYIEDIGDDRYIVELYS